jgi:hypothetical protein
MSCLLSRMVAGGAAGFLATVPMSAVMLVGHRWLPWRQRDPLPPQQINDELLESANLDDDLSRQERAGLAVANHFAYGAAMGSLYGGLTSAASPSSPVISGIAYGLSVWAGSYLGLVAALGLYRSATEEPGGRNTLMIAAHVVWGASLGILTELALPKRHQTCSFGRRGRTAMENSHAHENEKEYAR